MNETSTTRVRYVMKKYILLTFMIPLGCASSTFGLASEYDPGSDAIVSEADHEALVASETSVSTDTQPVETLPDTIATDSATIAPDTLVSDTYLPPPADTGPPPFVSTPGYVACASASDACIWSKGERCCVEDTGKLMCRTLSMPVCGYTKTYQCDEAADCGGTKCCLWPSGGSQCTCVDGAAQLCMTHDECPSGVCEPYAAWPGHGRCRAP